MRGCYAVADADSVVSFAKKVILISTKTASMDLDMSESKQLQTFAQALYEIRILLSGYLGSENQGDISVRQAAHLAYAFHNEAEAVLSGKMAESSRSIAMVAAMDEMLNTQFAAKFQIPDVSPAPDLELEAQQATALLAGKLVAKVFRPRIGEVGIQFEDGSRMFVDHHSAGVEISIT